MARRHRHLRMAHSVDNTNLQNNTPQVETETVINNESNNDYTNTQTTVAQVEETNTPQTSTNTEITNATSQSTTNVIRSPTLRARRYPSPRRLLINTLTQQKQHYNYQSNSNSKCNSSRSNNNNANATTKNNDNDDDDDDDDDTAMFHTPLGPSSTSVSPNITLIHSSDTNSKDNNENVSNVAHYGYNYPIGNAGVSVNKSANVNNHHRPNYLFPSNSTDSVSSTSHTSNQSYKYEMQYPNEDNNQDVKSKSSTSNRGNVKYVLTSPVSTVPSSMGYYSHNASAPNTSLSLPISPTGASPNSPVNLYSTGSGGMTVIYPRKGKVGPYYGGEDGLHSLSPNDEDNLGEVASQQNMELAEVQVEGYFAQSLGVLIPNDLPRSTLMYVLTASDGRDSMFKLIQYTLQLTICFLKTPELFSSEAQVLTEAWAERFYKNYNTIRHGRSLFKIGRGMLNLFTIQSVMERLWLKYEDNVFNQMTGAQSQTPNAISASMPTSSPSSSPSSSSYSEKRTRTHFSYSYRLFVKIVLFVLGKVIGLPVSNFAQKWKQALLIGGTDSTLTSPVGMFPQRTTQQYLNESYNANDKDNINSTTITFPTLSSNVITHKGHVNDVNVGKASLSSAPLLSKMPSNLYMHVAKVEQQPEELTTFTNTNGMTSEKYNIADSVNGNYNNISKAKKMSVLYFNNNNNKNSSYSPQYISLDTFNTPHPTSATVLEHNKGQEINVSRENQESKTCTAVPSLAANAEDRDDTSTDNKHSFSSDKDTNTLANSTTLGEDSINVFAPPPPMISNTLPSHYNESNLYANLQTPSLLENTNKEQNCVGIMQNESNVEGSAVKGDESQSIEQHQQHQPQPTLLQPLKDVKNKQVFKGSKETDKSNITLESKTNSKSEMEQTELITSVGASLNEPFYSTHAKETHFFSSLEDTPNNMFRTKAPSFSDQTNLLNRTSVNDYNNSKLSEEQFTKEEIVKNEHEIEEEKHMAYFAPLYSTEQDNGNSSISVNIYTNTENKFDDHHNASVMSFASMSENSDANADSSNQINELIPASQAEPIM